MSQPLPLEPPAPVAVLDRFPAERQSLLDLLVHLTPEQWQLPTVCSGWTVHDVALHILGVDLANLSRRRDGFRAPSVTGPADERWSSLVTFLNDFNELWVAAARRISPRLLCELLAFTAAPIAAYFRGRDLSTMGGAVAWAGPSPAPVWLDVGREYTERWVHQQQIRDAVGVPGFKEPDQLHPVLATFVHALPHALREVAAAPGACLRLAITGPAGGWWIAIRTGDTWTLGQDHMGPVSATVSLDQDSAWRLFTKGITREQAAGLVSFEGDRILGLTALDMVSIIA
jgi:uncharacterized protein (TIGR03083 family)